MLCECGCGRPAPIAKRTVNALGWVKGQPKRYIHGHNSKGKTTPGGEPGRRYGRLVILGDAEPVGSDRRVTCRCDCGSLTEAFLGHLRKGATKSCGCYRRDRNRDNSALRLRHGHAASRSGPASRTYNSWQAMWTRCTNERHPGFRHYGGRGITVCRRWRDFTNFLADMGERPDGETLDRIDPDGDYGPSNCRWATASEQARNRRPREVARAAG